MKPSLTLTALTAVVALALVLSASLASAAPALAGHDRERPHVTLSDPRDEAGPSFNPRAATDVTAVSVDWDGAKLTVGLRYAAEPTTNEFRLMITPETDPEISGECDDGLASVTIQGWEDFVGASLQLSDVGSWLDATVAETSETQARYVFEHPLLSKWMRDGGYATFVCMTGSAGGDTVFGGFDGKVLRLTTANATAALQQALARKFGPAFATAPRKWVRCPRQALTPASDNTGAAAGCAFEFGRPGGLFRSGSASILLIYGELDFGEELRAQSYRKRLQSCPLPPARSGWVNGVVLSQRRLVNSESLGKGSRCQRLVGPAGMAADIESIVAMRPSRIPPRVTVGFHGTNRAGFEEQVSFPCAVSRRGSVLRFDCRNRLGDRFVYSFRLTRR